MDVYFLEASPSDLQSFHLRFILELPGCVKWKWEYSASSDSGAATSSSGRIVK